MGRKALLVFLTSAFLSTAVYGTETEYEDVIHLKDGSVVRGFIVEEVPGETYKIEIYGGSVFVFEAAEVEKIVRETREANGEPSSFHEVATRYRSFLFGFAAVVGKHSDPGGGQTRYGGEFLIGWRFYAEYAAGIGFGYNWLHRYDIWHGYFPNYNLIPIYLHNRITYLRTDIIGLYVKFDIGYGLAYIEDTIGQHGGMLYDFGQGFEFGPPGFHGDISVGIRNQSFGGTDSENELIAQFGFSM